MAGKYTPEKMQEWKKRGYTAQNVMDWYGYEAWGAYTRFLSAPYSGTGDFAYPMPNFSGSYAPAWTPTYGSTTPPSSGAALPAGWHPPMSLPGAAQGFNNASADNFDNWINAGITPEQLAKIGADSATIDSYTAYYQKSAAVNAPSASEYQGNGAPAASYQPTTAHPFTNAQWASMTQAPWSDPRGVTVDGHTYTNQYNYIGPTTTGLTDPNAGWEQMNRYGQRLGTLGPLNNKNVMGRRRSAGNPLFNNRYGNGPAGPTQNNPTRMPPNVTPHNSDGGGTYTGGTYNDLINWRI